MIFLHEGSVNSVENEVMRVEPKVSYVTENHGRDEPRTELVKKTISSTQSKQSEDVGDGTFTPVKEGLGEASTQQVKSAFKTQRKQSQLRRKPSQKLANSVSAAETNCNIRNNDVDIIVEQTLNCLITKAVENVLNSVQDQRRADTRKSFFSTDVIGMLDSYSDRKSICL